MRKCKKMVATLSLGLLAFYLVSVVLAVSSPLNPESNGGWLPPGVDFRLRVNEINCMLSGVNPFDVWHGDVVVKPYVPFHGKARSVVEGKEGFTEFINAYAPWEYIMMLPFAVMPGAFSWVLYFLAMMAGVVALFCIGQRFCMRFAECSRELSVIVGSASVLFVAVPILHNFQVGNLSVPVLVAATFLAIALNRGCNVMAGVLWAFVMVKPQIGLAFAMPLLLRRRFTTCFVAAGICLAMTAIASFLCNASPIDLVMQAPAATANEFRGCGTFPFMFCPLCSNDVGIAIGLVVGVVVCFAMTQGLYRSGIRDWVVFMMPAAAVGAAWTYAQCFSFVMNWFFFLVLFSAIACRPKSKTLWLLAVLSAVFMTRIYNGVHFASRFLPGVFPESLMSESLYCHMDTLVSSAGLLVAMSLCAWLAGEKPFGTLKGNV